MKNPQPTPYWTVKVKTPLEIGTQTRTPVLLRAGVTPGLAGVLSQERRMKAVDSERRK